mmetsp:Transcript_5128/g.14335  ORF Transcript_5128/g.14335 Transcript_5128/m.14335 type:complete len:256 (-) Transcript_5128:504-1271(-)
MHATVFGVSKRVLLHRKPCSTRWGSSKEPATTWGRSSPGNVGRCCDIPQTRRRLRGVCNSNVIDPRSWPLRLRSSGPTPKASSDASKLLRAQRNRLHVPRHRLARPLQYFRRHLPKTVVSPRVRPCKTRRVCLVFSHHEVTPEAVGRREEIATRSPRGRPSVHVHRNVRRKPEAPPLSRCHCGRLHLCPRSCQMCRQPSWSGRHSCAHLHRPPVAGPWHLASTTISHYLLLVLATPVSVQLAVRNLIPTLPSRPN